MSGREVDTIGFGPVVIDAALYRQLALVCSDRIGAEHPTEHDDTDPKLAGRQLAHNPTVRDELLQLLDVIGFRKEQQ